ncbi:OmpH family outer membrane protein [Hugenholtzia roseola]|uniref:OmpH family outer membrane protein n=1 Tax=Hugenholtzia roseola TaxID=1002 RepID=UPI000411076D|nr:OmpH family outer membrane protein [Hugenholtzia roseola]
MKKTLFLAFLAATLFVFGANAQNTLKIGYTSATQILVLMPEFKVKQSELESYNKVLDGQLAAKQKEFQTKYEEYEKTRAQNPPVVNQQKENELRQLQQSFTDMQQQFQNDLAEKERALLEPLFGKIQDAINEVAKENQYTLVLNAFDGTNNPNILYAAEGIDITPLVLKKLGVEPPKEEAGN